MVGIRGEELRATGQRFAGTTARLMEACGHEGATDGSCAGMGVRTKEGERGLFGNGCRGTRRDVTTNLLANGAPIRESISISQISGDCAVTHIAGRRLRHSAEVKAAIARLRESRAMTVSCVHGMAGIMPLWQ